MAVGEPKFTPREAMNYAGFLPVAAGGALLAWLLYQAIWGD